MFPTEKKKKEHKGDICKHGIHRRDETKPSDVKVSVPFESWTATEKADAVRAAAPFKPSPEAYEVLGEGGPTRTLICRMAPTRAADTEQLHFLLWSFARVTSEAVVTLTAYVPGAGGVKLTL